MSNSNKISMICIMVFVLCLAIYIYIVFPQKKNSIKIGILHSLTGTLAISEIAVVDIINLAVEEINHAGGVLGRQIEVIIADGQSNDHIFAKQAENLITHDEVSVLFGCWTSATRKEVKEVVERYDHLLFYSVNYEGLEQSPNIVYLGATSNQQSIPGVTWALSHLGKRCFLVGSDYVFQRASNKIIEQHIRSLGGEVIGEAYIPLGSKNVFSAVQQIKIMHPDLIIHSITGDSNIPFFKELRAAGITSEKIPTLSFSIAETELVHLDISSMVGDYLVWSYFQNIDHESNRAFIQRFQKKYGKDRTINNNMFTSYAAVYLWAQAVEYIGSFDRKKVRSALTKLVYNGPNGPMYFDENFHLWHPFYLGKIQFDGQVDIILNSQKNIRPLPYPPYKTKEVWDKFLIKLYEGWGKQWAYTPA